MSKTSYIQIITMVTIISVAATGLLPKVIAQASTTSNSTLNSDSIEKLMAKAPPMTMAGGNAQANNYSAWLLICKAPPITNAETDCDIPVQLH
jgi:hypothetical protein